MSPSEDQAPWIVPAAGPWWRSDDPGIGEREVPPGRAGRSTSQRGKSRGGGEPNKGIAWGSRVLHRLDGAPTRRGMTGASTRRRGWLRVRFDPRQAHAVPWSRRPDRRVPHVHSATGRPPAGAIDVLEHPGPSRLSHSSTPGDTREQADLPAEQPSPREDARLPPADAHPRRAFHPLHPPQQGPQAPLRLSRGPGVPGARGVTYVERPGARVALRTDRLTSCSRGRTG